MLAGRATNLVDQAAVTCLHMNLHTVLSQLDQSVAVCLKYLRGIGVEWSAHPTDVEVEREYERVWRQLGTRQIADLIALPSMNDAGTRATMDVLTNLMVPSQMTDRSLFRLSIAYMVNLSLDQGNCDASCCAYSLFGWVFGSNIGDYSVALRFGQLSVDLVDRQKLDHFRARVYLNFAIFGSPWTQPIRSARVFLQNAFDKANIIGDLAYVGLCYYNLINNSRFIGVPLSEIEREAIPGIDFSRRTKTGLVEALILALIYPARTLSGFPSSLSTVGDEEFSEGAFVRLLEADPRLSLAAGAYWIRRIQTCVFMADHAGAAEAALKAGVAIAIHSLTATFVDWSDYHFYAAMARAGAIDARAAWPDEGRSHPEALVAHHQQLQIWAEHCPENSRDRAALVGAEIARLEGRDLEAERLYQQAIRSARANGFVHNEALACETAARFYAARGFDDIAEMYLVRARDGYRRWGADGVVRRMEARLSTAGRGRSARPRPSETASPDQQLDVAAVVKASQALSSEMLLPRLIERLMTIALAESRGPIAAC